MVFPVSTSNVLYPQPRVDPSAPTAVDRPVAFEYSTARPRAPAPAPNALLSAIELRPFAVVPRAERPLLRGSEAYESVVQKLQQLPDPQERSAALLALTRVFRRYADPAHLPWLEEGASYNFAGEVQTLNLCATQELRWLKVRHLQVERTRLLPEKIAALLQELETLPGLRPLTLTPQGGLANGNHRLALCKALGVSQVRVVGYKVSARYVAPAYRRQQQGALLRPRFSPYQASPQVPRTPVHRSTRGQGGLQPSIPPLPAGPTTQLANQLAAQSLSPVRGRILLDELP